MEHHLFWHATKPITRGRSHVSFYHSAKISSLKVGIRFHASVPFTAIFPSYSYPSDGCCCQLPYSNREHTESTAAKNANLKLVLPTNVLPCPLRAALPALSQCTVLNPTSPNPGHLCTFWSLMFSQQHRISVYNFRWRSVVVGGGICSRLQYWRWCHAEIENLQHSFDVVG